MPEENPEAKRKPTENTVGGKNGEEEGRRWFFKIF